MKERKILVWCEKLRHDVKASSTWFVHKERAHIDNKYRKKLDDIAFHTNAQHLLDQGYVVVSFLPEAERRKYLEKFQHAELGFREYARDEKNPSKNTFGDTFGTKENPYVLGGFGAYGNPSSFHNEFVREMRVRKCVFIPIFGHLLKIAEKRGLIPDATRYNLAQLFDRMCKRPKNSSTSRETYHRDLIPLSRESDCTIGGWIQLSDDTSFFSCEPKTHIFPTHTTTATKGFALEKKKECTKEVAVPPGCILFFFQNMGHCVYPIRRKQDSYRMFSVWLLTTKKTHMMKYEDVIEKQGVPRLASNQKPPMYSANHGSFWLEKLTIPWSERNFLPQVMVTKTKKNEHTSYTIVEQYMTSLVDYDLPLYPKYTSWEKQLFEPRQTWTLPHYGKISLFT
jgi:hypothetical protein